MARRIIASLPVWGLSVLAVGSIGAPLTGVGNSDMRSHSPSVTAPVTRLIEPKSAAIAGFAPRRQKLRDISTQRASVAPLGSNQRSSFAASSAKTVNLALPGLAVSAMAASAVTIPQAQQPGQRALSAVASPAGYIAQVVENVSHGKVSAIVPATAVVASAVPRNSVAPASAKSLLTDAQSVYGTAARNAYKVYYPQIETAAAAKADTAAMDYGAPDGQDARELKRDGSYLFYIDPAAPDAAGKLSPTAGAGRSADEKASAKTETAKPEKRLTEPALQGRPLDFGSSPDSSVSDALAKLQAAQAKK